jgi:DICT domain-containing protein
MKSAWVVTVFGYSAPTSDAAAIAVLSESWGIPEERNLEEIEIIDIRPDEELASSWALFIHTHHYRTCQNYLLSPRYVSRENM